MKTVIVLGMHGTPPSDFPRAEKTSDWWAFRQPKRPAVPNVQGATTPVDAFIFDKLRSTGIRPCGRASTIAAATPLTCG